jgi:hypothetical protein
MEHIQKGNTTRNGENHMKITYLVHEPIKLEHVAAREAAHQCTLRVTRGTTLRREASSIMRVSVV